MKCKAVVFMFIAAFLVCSCTKQTVILTKEYKEDAPFFDMLNISFDFHLETLGDYRGKIIQKLIYNDMGFEEFVKFKKDRFTGNPDDIYAEVYALRYDANGVPYAEDAILHQSDLILEYRIIGYDGKFITIEHSGYEYRAGAAHGNYRKEYYTVDIKEEKILEVDDIAGKMPDALLKELIEAKYDLVPYLRENIWPPDSIGFSNGKIVLLWNTYSITPYSTGPIELPVSKKIIRPFLTDKGKSVTGR